jgi:hypothetical protein
VGVRFITTASIPTIKLYSESYSRFDPLVSLPAFGQVVGIPDLIDYDEYRKGPF